MQGRSIVVLAVALAGQNLAGCATRQASPHLGADGTAPMALTSDSSTAMTLDDVRADAMASLEQFRSSTFDAIETQQAATLAGVQSSMTDALNRMSQQSNATLEDVDRVVSEALAAASLEAETLMDRMFRWTITAVLTALAVGWAIGGALRSGARRRPAMSLRMPSPHAATAHS